MDFEQVLRLIVFGVIYVIIPFAICASLVYLAIYLLRRFLFWITPIIRLLEECMWVMYNPLRVFSRVNFSREKKLKFTRFVYVVGNLSLIFPAYKIFVYFITTPLRVVTSLYFDVILYLAMMFADLWEEASNPKMQRMRHEKGTKYLFRWFIALPKRLVVFVAKNILSILDAVCMFIVSVAFPTFSMYHGTDQVFGADIYQRGRWKVGARNFAGTGVYFGRNYRVAKHYSQKSTHGNPRILLVRVSFSVLRNFTTLKEKHRKMIAGRGEKLAQSLKFPIYSVEMWRSDSNLRGWEYVLLRPNDIGNHIKTWRIRGIAVVNTEKNMYERLWGGKSHYCLSLVNIAMTLLSAVICIFLAAGFEFLFFQ